VKFTPSRVPFIAKSNSETALTPVHFWGSYRHK